MSYLFFALHVVEGFTVNLRFLFITNSTQIGLLCHTLLGSSHLQDSVITHSNYRLLGKYMQGKVKCSVDIWKCCGINVLILFFNPVIKVVHTSTFIIEGTNLSYGVNLAPKASSFSMGAGVMFKLNQRLQYDVHITISKCFFNNNIAAFAVQLYMIIFSNCSVLVKESHFIHANRITGNDPLELVPVVHPYLGILVFFIEDMHGDSVDVEIVMDDVHIAENVGVGLFTSLLIEHPQSNIQLRLNRTKMVNVLQENKNIKNVKRCRNGMPKSIQTREG